MAFKFNGKEIRFHVNPSVRLDAVAYVEEVIICSFQFVADGQDPDGHWHAQFEGRFADLPWRNQVTRFPVLSEGILAMQQVLKEHESTLQRIDEAEKRAREELEALEQQ